MPHVTLLCCHAQADRPPGRSPDHRPDCVFAALCAALDAGDDTALPILADALEEADSPLSAGLRAIPPDARPLHSLDRTWRWFSAGWWEDDRSTVAEAVFNRLPAGSPGATWRDYPTRSAAFLAIAEALTAQE